MDKKRGWTLVIASLALGVVGFVFYIMGVVSGAMAAVEDPEGAELGMAFVFLMLGALLFMASFALLVAWYATSNRDLNQVTGGGFNTILWTILLFIPIANIVAMYKLADHIQQGQNARGVTGLHPVVVFLLLWIVSPAGLIVAQMQMDKVAEAGGLTAATTMGTAGTA